MGKQLQKFRKRQNALRKIRDIESNKNNCFLVHYSCESFYDIKDGRTPRITSIAIRNLSSGQTNSFSLHKSAELDGVTIEQIGEQYDRYEKLMLDEYFEYIRARLQGFIYIHWNMRDINYGFQAIEHRYKVLSGNPSIIPDDSKFDFARALIQIYGPPYIEHGESGRLFSLMKLNKITSKDILTGKEEAAAFENKEFVKLHQSTLRKVDVMSNLYERLVSGTLKTKSTWRDAGIHPAIISELITEHWIYSILAIFATTGSIIGFILLF